MEVLRAPRICVWAISRRKQTLNCKACCGMCAWNRLQTSSACKASWKSSKAKCPTRHSGTRPWSGTEACNTSSSGAADTSIRFASNRCSPVLDLINPISICRSIIYQADNARVHIWRVCCYRIPICCCSTSRPITSISKPSNGSKII